MRPLAFAALLAIGAGAGGFLAGRSTDGTTPGAGEQRAHRAGVAAGREAAFCCYDGGWAYGEPYIVVLRRGGPTTTYRIARRWPFVPGLEYRRCGARVCAGKPGGPAGALP